jgi:hypothetical protein
MYSSPPPKLVYLLAAPGTEELAMDAGMTNQSRVFVASEYHVVITTTIPVNRIARRMEGEYG